MKIYLGSDHGGYRLKEELKAYLKDLGHEVEDLGANEFNPEDDYPDFIFPVALRVADAQGKLQEAVFGIVIGRSGIGEAIAANKIKGARAALVWNEESARKSREHNDANILALGADFTEVETAKKIVKTFLETPFSGEERHKRRILKITNLERNLGGVGGGRSPHPRE